MELSKTVPAVLVVLSLFVFPGCSSDSFNAMHPRGLITAHSLRNSRQKQDFTLPAPVSISSGILRIQESRGGSNRAETGRRFGRQMEIEDGVPVVEGVRVPDDPREKNIVYRNARIINNVLVTDNGETPELSHQVTQSVTVNKKPSVLTSGYTVSSHPINTVSSNAINSLSSLAKLVLSSSVKSALDARDKEKPTKYNNAKYVSTFRTPPPLRSYVAKSAPSGRSFNSHPVGFTARHHPTSESRFIPISRSHSPSIRDTTQESFWNNIHQLEPQYRVRTYNGYASRIGSLADKVSRSEVLTNRKRYTHTSDKKNIYPLKKNETYENVGRIVPRKPFDENKSYSQVSRNNMDNNESNTPNETQTEDESEEMTIETLVKQSQKEDDDWEPKDRSGQQIYEELTGRSMNSDQSFMDSLKRTGPVDQLVSSANNNAFQASTFYSKNGGLTDSSKQSAAGAANSGVSSTNSLNSLTGTNNLQNLYSNSLSSGNSDLTSNTWSSNNNGGSALQTLPDKQTTSSQTSLPQLTQQEQQAYFKQLAALEAANAVAYTQSSSTPVTSQQQLLNKYALEQANRRQQINNQPNLQHHNSGQPMPIQGPTGLFGTVIHPFRQMGQSLMQTIEPLISPDTQHQFAIPLPRSQIENKIDFFGKQLSSVSGGGGYAPAGNPTSYGGGPVVGPSPTYGAPSVTQYSASTDTYGGNFDTLSVINSDSLPFFAGAALSAAIAAFCISAIASTTNVAIGKRSTDESAGIAKMITNYVAENYHPLLEQGFEEISLYTNEQCVRELSCRAMEMMIGHENLISIEERIETAFEQLNHNGDLRHQVNDLMKSAEKQKCHQYKCWQKVWNSDLMSGFNPFMDTKYD